MLVEEVTGPQVVRTGTTEFLLHFTLAIVTVVEPARTVDYTTFDHHRCVISTPLRVAAVNAVDHMGFQSQIWGASRLDAGHCCGCPDRAHAEHTAAHALLERPPVGIFHQRLCVQLGAYICGSALPTG